MAAKGASVSSTILFRGMAETSDRPFDVPSIAGPTLNQQSRSDRSTQLCLRAREPVEDCTADLAMGAKGMKNGASRVGCPGRVGLGGGGLRRRGADRKTFGRLDCC
jgi:hypothetical protein